MRIAIVGFPGCGKSTCFKAITQKTAHLGTVKIPDDRLEKLRSIFNPKKLTYAEIVFEDLPGFHIPQIREVEALMEVLGIFSGRDPIKDIEDMDVEFILSDLEIINHRFSSLNKELKVSNPPRERLLERDTLMKCKETLEKNMPLRNLELEREEEKEIRGFQFLSKKPIFVLANIDEGQKSSDIIKKIEEFCDKKGLKCFEFCAKLEAEIADLEEKERNVYLKEMGLEKEAPERIVKLAYSALGYITFFTVKGTETKAWPLKNGEVAIEAAGRIHTDMQKGFIKAEVINFNDLITCGSMQEARKKALLKLEGKEYIIKDGDIIDFRFNV